MQEELRFTDVHRIVLGKVPWTFAVEAVLRIVFVYLLLLISMRLMGKRMSSMTTRNELAALVSLAAAVGPALQDPSRGLLPPLVIAVVVVGIQRTAARWSVRSESFEKVTQGDVATLVIDGEVQLAALREVAIAPERLFAELRAHGVMNLGAVERVYFETNGSFTILKHDDEKPGLSLLPEGDEELRRAQRSVDDHCVCTRCGRLQKCADQCERCGNEDFDAPVLSGPEARSAAR